MHDDGCHETPEKYLHPDVWNSGQMPDDVREQAHDYLRIRLDDGLVLVSTNQGNAEKKALWRIQAFWSTSCSDVHL